MHSIRGLIFIYMLCASPAFARDADTALWRLDCGQLGEIDGGIFSVDQAYDDTMVTLTNSCYLIRHRGQHILWDAGFPLVALQPGAPTLNSQLATLGLSPSDISTVILSHNHMDHTGQLDLFSQAELIIGAADWAEVGAVDNGASTNPYVNTMSFKPWLESVQNVRPVSGDLDLFGDGVIAIKEAPGHTEGASFLLLNLPETGFVILSGDVTHFEQQYEDRSVAVGSYNIQQARETMDHVAQLARSLPALFVIGHDPQHKVLLPTFPEPAK